MSIKAMEMGKLGVCGVMLACSGMAWAGEDEAGGVVGGGVMEEELVGGAWWGMSLGVGWDSLYVSEGRDNLDGSGLVGTTLEAEAFGFTAGAWHASSPDATYEELNLYAEYGIELGAFEFYAGYTYLNFPDDDAEDHEVGAGVGLGGLPLGLAAAVDWYYSFEAAGSFFEASLTRGIGVTDWLAFGLFCVMGWNEGYIADGHDGANHAAVGLQAMIALSENIELGAHAAWNWAIDSDPGSHPGDELLEDFFHGGVSLTFAF